MSFCNEQFELMSTRHSKIEKENAVLRKENATLSAECKELKEAVAVSERTLLSLEQYFRNKNIEIKGLTASEDKDLPEIPKKVGDTISEPITEPDVDICHRVPRKDGGCPNFVVQFHSRAKRDAVDEKARKKRVRTDEIGAPGRYPVYVNDHLCPELKILLKQATARKNEKQWKYVWTDEGKIFARKTDTSRVLRITSPNDLEKMQ
ncbi:hypothetical protein HPB48_013813 [Haemaphysalis longicornis]|uniref:FP protein C-terminal domain-containing protein n=1 Tax=Haemaphysalis longicornis TaxID=44386 RepID=A0A9J6GJX0_HAELO|nr:hypothetical protein HPB48_013813 [Haemaphysalis longicornis]